MLALGVSVVATASRRVLIADDATDASEPLALLLTMDGCEVRTCDRDCDVVPLACAFRPHVILLDLVFHGGTSGIDLLAQLRGQPETARTVVAVLSGRADTKMKEVAEQFGADFYFVKPMDPDELLRFVMSVDRREGGGPPPRLDADRRLDGSSSARFIRSRSRAPASGDRVPGWRITIPDRRRHGGTGSAQGS